MVGYLYDRNEGCFHMKKVLFVITKSNWGGAQRYVYDLATKIHGYEPVVACGGTGELLQRLNAAGIRTVELDSLQRDVHILKDFIVFYDLVKLFLKERPDIVHLNSSKIGGIGAVAGRVCMVPRIIFTSHGWFHNESRPWLVQTITWMLHAATQLLVHETIANSKATMKSAPFPSRAIYIPLAREPEEFFDKQKARAALEKMGVSFPQGVPCIGSVGELHANKGQDLLIQALQKVKLPFVAIIAGDGEKKEVLQKMIAQFNLTTKVFMVGHIQNAARIMTAFDFFVLPSRTESFGYVAVEAAQANIPVVAFSVGAVPETITDGETGLLAKAGDVEKLASHINTLLGNEELRKRLGNALRESVAKKYNIDRMITETAAVYG